MAVAYHSVHDPQPGVCADDVILPPGALERDVRALQAAGYRFLTAGELVAETGGARPPARTALLTFDDGWLDGLTVAAPLLARLGVPATFFVCPGLWGGHDLRMGDAGHVVTEPQARELHAAGMELGAHSLTHPDLRAIDDDALRGELVGSKEAVEAITGRPCRALAYSFGLYDGRVQRAADAAGFSLAFTFSPGRWRPLAAPRTRGPLLSAMD